MKEYKLCMYPIKRRCVFLLLSLLEVELPGCSPFEHGDCSLCRHTPAKKK